MLYIIILLGKEKLNTLYFLIVIKNIMEFQANLSKFAYSEQSNDTDNIKKINLSNTEELENIRNIEINNKLSISSDNGKTWGLATDLYDYKKNGINTNPYLFTYKLASTIDSGNNWRFISEEN